MMKTLLFMTTLLLPLSLQAQISVYFNKSVDTTLLLQGNLASGDNDFSLIVLERLSQAEYSVDMMMYNLSVQPVVDGLIAAKNRGVKVRVIGHIENVEDNSRFQQLQGAGIPVHTNPEAPSGERQQLMHNKVFLIDARPGRSANSTPTTITGSWNATVNQTYNDPNNLLVIEDAEVAAAYLTEFEEMWGGSGDTPDPRSARFGPSKQDNTPHDFTLSDGTQIEVRFSPSDSTASRINFALSTGQSSIYTANLTFTYNQFGTTLRNQVNRFSADVRCIIDNVNDQGSEYEFLSGFTEAFDWQENGIFHHKYGIVDALPLGSGSVPIVVTGSHNWTSSAENFNDENTVIIYSEKIVNLFLQEFSARYKEVGGTKPLGETITVNQD
ncbi:MAG: hypothetical protein J4G05_07925 [Chlorobi bacterium]|nr:hypothetical protein [Chlorobiota bacterium]